MIEFLKILFYFLIFPGFLFTAIVGLLSTWIDRKVGARVQWRVGPPWYQPFADILKLFGKESILPQGASAIIFFGAPTLGITAVIIVSMILWLTNMYPKTSFIGDIIVILYLLLMPSIALIIGGFAARNPLASLGASREMKLILAYELPFIIAIFTVVAKANSILFGNILNYQLIHGMAIASLSGFIAFIVSLLAVQAKLALPPFDISEAEQEIMGGPCVEYSGPALAIFKLTKAMMLFTLPVFLITIFLSGIDVSSIPSILWFILKYVIILTLIILIKNTNPRLRIDQAVTFFWGKVTGLAVIGFLFALLGI